MGLHVAALLMYLLGIISGLIVRCAMVFLGTYSSDNKKTKRAGLVADLNAIVLAAAVILLLTSRVAFHHSEESTQTLGWQRLVNDTNYGCVTGTQDYFEGSRCPDLMYVCARTDTSNRTTLSLEKPSIADSGPPGYEYDQGIRDLEHLLHELKQCGGIADCRAYARDADGWTLTVDDVLALPRVAQWTKLTLYRGETLQTISTNAYMFPSPSRHLLQVTKEQDGGVSVASNGQLGNFTVGAASVIAVHNNNSNAVLNNNAGPSINGLHYNADSNFSAGSTTSAVAGSLLPVPVMVLSGPDADADAASAYCRWTGNINSSCMSNYTSMVDMGNFGPIERAEALLGFPNL